MIDLIYNKNDLRYLFLVGDKHELIKIEAYFNKIPNYMFLPSFSGIPKPVVFIHKVVKDNRVIYFCNSGLWKEIRDFCKSSNITVNGPNNYFKLTDFNLSLEDFTKLINSWNLNVKPRDYQIEATWNILHYRQSMSQLATRSGKTLMAYIVMRYLIESKMLKQEPNILMIVPNITLVKQSVSDLEEYKEFFKSDIVCASLENVSSKDSKKDSNEIKQVYSNLTIGTFQSLIKRCDRKSSKYNPKFFDKYNIVLIDEVHKANCKSIEDILKALKNIEFKFGFSGTIPDNNTIENFGCQSLVGPVIQNISTTELVNDGYLAKPIITQLHIHYKESLIDNYIKYAEYLCSNFEIDSNGSRILLDEKDRDLTMIHKKKLPLAIYETKNNLSKAAYCEFLINLCKAKGSNLLTLEQMLAEHSQKKLDVMTGIIADYKESNGIIFAHNDAYINYLEDYYKKIFPNKNIYKMKGSTALKTRTKIIESLNSTNNNLLIASYGVTSTGLTFKNIDYCVFSQSFKSKIINMQSLGRGLLLTDSKKEFYIYDLIDYFPTKRLERHGKEKLKMYKDAQFEVVVKDV
jgi:superfamily II DNA or RNA helicase